jgi:hypothetical protein
MPCKDQEIPSFEEPYHASSTTRHFPSHFRAHKPSRPTEFSRQSSGFHRFASRCGRSSAYLDGELALGEVGGTLLGLLELLAGVLGRKSSADGASLLGPQVQRQVLLVLVEQTELGALLKVDDGEDTGDGLAEIVAR